MENGMERVDIAIIGTGPAGVSAAITAKVRNKSVLLIGSRELSEKMSKAHQILNYPGLPEVSGADLVAGYKKQLAGLGIEVTEKRVNAVYAMGDYFGIQASGEILEASTVILATGIVMGKPFPGENELLGSGVSYCATCDAQFFRGKEVAVIGYRMHAANDHIVFLQFLIYTLHLGCRRIPADAETGDRVVAPQHLLELVPYPVTDRQGGDLFLIELLQRDDVALVLQQGDRFFIQLGGQPCGMGRVQAFGQSLRLDRAIVVQPCDVFILQDLDDLRFYLFPVQNTLFQGLLHGCKVVNRRSRSQKDDITRIASSSPVMWENICLSNQEQILRLIDSFCGELGHMRSAIAASDSKALMEAFTSAKDYRDSLTLHANGTLKQVYELYMAR